MTKIKLEFEEEVEYLILGISTHQKDYRLAWAVNRALHCNLSREHDYRLSLSNGSLSLHPYFRWDEPDGHFSYIVATNRGSEGFLIPEYKTADYLFLVTGMTEQINAHALVTDLKEISFVLAAFEIDGSRVKSLQNLMFE